VDFATSGCQVGDKLVDVEEQGEHGHGKEERRRRGEL
jgi:hypothetical protein